MQIPAHLPDPKEGEYWRAIQLVMPPSNEFSSANEAWPYIQVWAAGNTMEAAALIAAAPDLLYAANRAVLIFASLANGIMVDESVLMQSGKELRDAIKKAESVSE